MNNSTMEEECRISLGLGIGTNHEDYYFHAKHKSSRVQLHALFPTRPKEEEEEQQQPTPPPAPPKRSRNRERDKEDLAGDGTRKKLRLTEEQAALLEDTFKENNTLTSFQKRELAEKLNLSPRQVEVWFQNRRARNKLKQTEVDFQLLKKWYEIMNTENMELKKELEELKQTRMSEGSALYLDNLQKVTTSETELTLCPCCSQMSIACSKSRTSEDSSIA